MPRQETQHRRQIGPRHAQIAAGDGADQEIDLIEQIRNAPPRLVDLQANRRQSRDGRCDGHDVLPSWTVIDSPEIRRPYSRLRGKMEERFSVNHRGTEGAEGVDGDESIDRRCSENKCEPRITRIHTDKSRNSYRVRDHSLLVF